MSLRANCVALWKMNDDAANKIVVDDSDSGNDGEAEQNTDQLSTAGKIKGALIFDPVVPDFITIADDTFSSLTIGTLAFWVYMDSLVVIAVFCASNLASASTYLMLHVDETGRVYFQIRVNGIYKVYQRTVDSVISATTWHFIVLVQDGTAVKLYVDNVLKATEDAGITNNAPGAFFSDLTGTISNFIGKFDRSVGAGLYWDGMIDVGVISDKALPEGEIAFLWNEGNGREHLGIARPLVGGSLASGRKGLV